MSLSDFNQRWGKLRETSKLVEALDKTEDLGAFTIEWDRFRNYVRERTGGFGPVGEIPERRGRQEQLDFGKVYLASDTKDSLEYALENLGAIFGSMERDNLKTLAKGVVPIIPEDIGRAYDDFDGLVGDYRKRKKRLEEEVKDIPEREEERRKVYEKEIEKYGERLTLISNNRDLVQGVVNMSVLTSYLQEKNGPNTRKISELYFAHLNGLLDGIPEDKQEENKMLVEVIRLHASRKPEYLINRYIESLVEPAEEQVNAEVNRRNANTLRAYLRRNVGVMDEEGQVRVFDRFYDLVNPSVEGNEARE